MADDQTSQSDNVNNENTVEGEAKQLSHPQLIIADAAQQRQNLPYRVVATTTQHRGPLPTAEYLREIKEIVPDGPERILAMAEKNADHRRRMDEKELDAMIEYNKGLLARSNRGLAAGFTVSLAFGAAAVYLTSTGHGIVGSIIGGLDIVALVSVFVIGHTHGGDSPKPGNESKEELDKTARKQANRLEHTPSKDGSD